MAPNDISIFVQEVTRLRSVEFATNTTFNAIPICPAVVDPLIEKASVMRLVASAATMRSRTILNHCWRHKRTKLGCWDASTQRIFRFSTCFSQPNARIVVMPSTYSLVSHKANDRSLDMHTDSRKLEYTAERDSRSSSRSCRDVRRYIFCTKYKVITQRGIVVVISFCALNSKTPCTMSLKTSARISELASSSF